MQCWEPGNRWALEQAKYNLANKYFLVGLTEELEAFIQILESTLPRQERDTSALMTIELCSMKVEHISFEKLMLFE